MNKSVEFKNRLDVVESLGIKVGQDIKAKMRDLQYFENRIAEAPAVNGMEYRAIQLEKCIKACETLVSKYEGKEPKDTTVFYSEKMYTTDMLDKKARQYFENVSELARENSEHARKVFELETKISNIIRSIPNANKAEFNQIAKIAHNENVERVAAELDS